ncbi:hypothetical protein LTS06_009291, partial [Exophiala xenobiotica]
ELIESKSSVAELQAKNEKLANLLADLVAANEGDTEARSLAVQYLEDQEYEDTLHNASSGPGSSQIPQGTPPTFERDSEPSREMDVDAEHSSWRSPADFNLAGPSRLSHLSQLILTDNEPSPPEKYPPAAWTNATNDDNLVQHLISLYFSWEYPVFASLSKEHFLLDFHSGSERFCSSLLVNAMLALGARFCDLVEVRKDKDNRGSAGDQFYEEAQRLLGFEDTPSLTKIQALGLMSLRQASCGHDMSGWHLSRYAMRNALDLDLHLADSQDRRADRLLYSNPERQVSAATFWGSYTLEQAWCLCIGRSPQVSLEETLVRKPVKIDEIEHEPWQPYTDQGIHADRSLHQPSNLRSVYKAFAELSEIVHKTNLCLQAEDTRDITARVRGLYTEYLQFYGSLPDSLRLGGNSTPPVLFCHIYYHFAVLLLFRPFYNTGILDTVAFTRLVCSEATENILSLVKAYQNIYSLRRTPAFFPYLVMTAEVARMADHKTGPNGHRIYHTPSIKYLGELALAHPFATRAMVICKFFRDGWEIRLAPEDDCEVPDGVPGDADLPHEATFFRPDADLERHHGGIASLEPLRSGSTAKLRFMPFPQQGSHLGNMTLSM